MAHQHNVDRMVAGFREFREDETFCGSAAFMLWRSLALQCAAGVRDVQGASLQLRSSPTLKPFHVHCEMH